MRNPEIENYAQDFMNQQSDATYTFVRQGYSGAVEVEEWDPIVVGGDVRNTVVASNIDDWLSDIAKMGGVDLSWEELAELADLIESKVL